MTRTGIQILFNKTIDECRIMGGRGGRVRARNLRLRKSREAPRPAEIPVVTIETTAQAIARLEHQFPWLMDAEKLHRPLRGGVRAARPVL